MAWRVLIIKGIDYTALFSAVVLRASAGDGKQSPAVIRSCPPDIQEEYFKTRERSNAAHRPKKVIFTKGFVLVREIP